MGNTCKPMADSFQCMTKSTTNKKNKKIKNKKVKKNDSNILKTHQLYLKKKIKYMNFRSVFKYIYTPYKLVYNDIILKDF